MPLAVKDAEQVLCEMLKRHGLDPRAPGSIRETWPVFQDFVAIESEATGPDADGVLYQCGTFAFHGVDEFYVDFLRQFEVPSQDGGYDHLEQLHCEFRFPITEETRSLGRFSAWWFPAGGVPWPDFARMVERRPEFIALRGAHAGAVRIEQEIV